MEIGVVLNTFRRKNVRMQLDAIAMQTIQPKEVLIWRNDDWPDDEFKCLAEGNRFVKASENFGVWPRFFAASLISCEFIAVFDDDTIPGSRWLENCRDCYRKNRAVYGSHGIRLPSDKYRGGVSFGWKKSCSQAERVDVVGHAWFFPRWLASRVLDVYDGCLTAGEDMALSYVAQVNGFDTFTAPHPAADLRMWGSLSGRQLGHDEHAISHTKSGWNGYEKEYQRFRAMGWKLLCDG